MSNTSDERFLSELAGLRVRLSVFKCGLTIILQVESIRKRHNRLKNEVAILKKRNALIGRFDEFLRAIVPSAGDIINLTTELERCDVGCTIILNICVTSYSTAIVDSAGAIVLNVRTRVFFPF